MILEQYLHTLISSDPDFSPTPEQVAQFLKGLSALGAAPLNPTLLVLKHSGRFRSFKNPVTGESKSIPAYDRVVLQSNSEVASAIGLAQQYFVSLDGQGPPNIPPFPLYDLEGSAFTEDYGLIVRCCLRPEPVSMSDLGDQRTVSERPRFGEVCAPHNTTGLFSHPVTNQVIEVPNAGCARFWVEFEFGKWLLPKIENSLEILDPTIARLATGTLGVTFVQGFHHF